MSTQKELLEAILAGQKALEARLTALETGKAAPAAPEVKAEKVSRANPGDNKAQVLKVTKSGYLTLVEFDIKPSEGIRYAMTLGGLTWDKWAKAWKTRKDISEAEIKALVETGRKLSPESPEVKKWLEARKASQAEWQERRKAYAASKA